MEPVSSSARRVEDGPAGADLLLRMRAGDRGALDELYERYSRPAFALARRLLDDDVLAEDVVVEVFLGVWRDPGAVDAVLDPLSSRLLAMVHHRAVDAVRREQSHRRRQAPAQDEQDRGRCAPTPGRDVGDAAGSQVVAAQVRSALSALPAEQRQVLALAYYGGYTQREVAALTGTPLDTVKVGMLAGMRRLREELGGIAGGLGGALGEPAAVDGPGR